MVIGRMDTDLTLRCISDDEVPHFKDCFRGHHPPPHLRCPTSQLFLHFAKTGSSSGDL